MVNDDHTLALELNLPGSDHGVTGIAKETSTMSGSRGEEGEVFVTCPGCGLRLPGLRDEASNPKVNASAECQRLCHELSRYTLSHGDAFFIHQVAVDAYAAQHAGPA
jgi:hypothetical protein